MPTQLVADACLAEVSAKEGGNEALIFSGLTQIHKRLEMSLSHIRASPCQFQFFA